MTASFDAPPELPQTVVDAAKPGCMTASGQPAARLAAGGGR